MKENKKDALTVIVYSLNIVLAAEDTEIINGQLVFIKCLLCTSCLSPHLIFSLFVRWYSSIRDDAAEIPRG